MTRPGNTESLPQLATKIHALERKTIASTIEIGRLLQVAFDRFEHGDRAEYHAWVENEFAWSERTARRYRDLYELQIGHSVQFDKLNISVSALYFLAGLPKDGDLPDGAWVGAVWANAAIEEVIRQAKGSSLASRKRITRAVAVEIVNEHIAKLEAKQAELDAATEATEPELDVGAEPEIDVDAAEPELEPELDVDADEPEPVVDAEPPEPNELSKALDVIRDNGFRSDLWKPTTRLIDSVELQGIIDTLRAVAATYYGGGSLKTAADRAEARSREKRHIAKETQRREALNAPLLAPITPEKEQAYTRLIKTCTLYEGACDLSWSEYFDYRDGHPECEPLTKANLAYASQWTSCAVREAA